MELGLLKTQPRKTKDSERRAFCDSTELKLIPDRLLYRSTHTLLLNSHHHNLSQPSHLSDQYVVSDGLPFAAGSEKRVSTNTFCIPSSLFSNL